MNVVYFELNNWFAGKDYPYDEPFTTWCGDDENLYFCNEKFVEKNKLCVVTSLIDMSINWCITAPKEFVEKYCPKLLGEESTEVTFVSEGPEGETEIKKSYPYKNFLRFPDENGDVIGQWGDKFLEWSEENIGIVYHDEEDGKYKTLEEYQNS